MKVEGNPLLLPEKNTRQVSKRTRRVLARSAALAIGVPFILSGCSDTPQSPPEISPSPSVSSSTIGGEIFPSESPSATDSTSPSPTESEGSSEISKDVLALVPRMGLLTYGGSQSEHIPYASGIVLSKNQFLTSAHLFGKEIPGTLCGDYQNAPFSYSVKTKGGDHPVVSLQRHPDPRVDLAILTISGEFEEDKNPRVKFATFQESGKVTVLNFQDNLDSTTRSPSDGPALFAGILAPTTTTQNIYSPYYGSADWKTSLVTTTNTYGFNPQTGQRDSSQDGFAKPIGSGGPLVFDNGGIVALQTAIPGQSTGVSSFLATKVTTPDMNLLESARRQPC